METLEKLKTERLNLLLDFCNDLPSLARRPMAQVEQQLEQHLTEFYSELTENLIQLYGADLTSYIRSVLWSIKKVNINEYSRSLQFYAGHDLFYKFRRQTSKSYSAFYRYPVYNLFDLGMENAERWARIQHMEKVLELIRQKLEETGSFILKSYLQTKEINSNLVDEEIWISKNLEREQEGLWMDLISLVKLPENPVNDPNYFWEFKLHQINISVELERELESNYYKWEEEITRPYLQQMKALFLRQAKEINELVPNENNMKIRTGIISTLHHLVEQVEKLQEKQFEEPFLESMESLLQGSEFERILIQLKKDFWWNTSWSPELARSVDIKKSCQNLGIKEDVLKKAVSILETPQEEWPEDAQKTLQILKQYWDREEQSRIRESGFLEYGLYDIFCGGKLLSGILSY